VIWYRLVLPVVVLVVTACTHGDVFGPSVRFDGRNYDQKATVVIPSEDLVQIGSATINDVPIVTDPTVFAVRDIDPVSLVALRIDPASDSADGYALFVWTEVEAFPVAICRYVDASDTDAPEECGEPDDAVPASAEPSV
jgi:hypothetical protein